MTSLRTSQAVLKHFFMCLIFYFSIFYKDVIFTTIKGLRKTRAYRAVPNRPWQDLIAIYVNASSNKLKTFLFYTVLQPHSTITYDAAATLSIPNN